MSLVVDAAAYSYIGGRKNNEDNFYLNGVYLQRGMMDDGGKCSALFSGSNQIYAVCDGMGGALYGEEAALIAVCGIRNYQLECMQPAEDAHIRRLVFNISNEINAFSEKNGINAGGSGSTLAMIVMSGRYMRTVNVGDSRIYRIRNGALTRLTKDDSYVQQLVDAGGITEDAAFRHPMKNMITQHLGMAEAEKNLAPAISSMMELQPGDRFLICSDGVSDVLEDGAIMDVVKNGTSAEAAEAVVRASAKEAGRLNASADNITLVMLEVRETDRKISFKSTTGVLGRLFGRK